jgi:3-oxoacyl-[acyl-carrier protein] reductase
MSDEAKGAPRFAVVTGASRGVGRATAIALARRGLAVGLVGRASNELEETRSLALESGAPEVRTWLADLADPRAVEATGRRLAAEVEVEVLVNNAGVAHRTRIEETSTESYEEQIAVNLSAPFILSREVLPGMRRRARGRIVHVGSISSTLGTPRLAAYCASKWGLVGLMKSLAEEIRDSGLMTVAILPGSIDTRMLEGSGFPPRMTADEVAKSIVYFALDAPLSHNGSVIEMFGV